MKQFYSFVLYTITSGAPKFKKYLVHLGKKIFNLIDRDDIQVVLQFKAD